MTASEHFAQSIVTSGDAIVTEQRRRGEVFRSLHVRGNPIVLFNAWDVGSAKAIAASGAKAIATSSRSVANANGFRDGERIPLGQAIDILRRMASAVEIPVTADLESGYGDGPEVVGTTIRMAIDVGAIGCNLEDSFPTNGELRTTTDQVKRISRARHVADDSKISFFINARTDVFFQRPAEQHDNSDVQKAIERARAYADAGADGLFAPGLVDTALIARLAERSPLPLNIMVEEATPLLSALAQYGVSRISYGPRPYLLAMKALEEVARVARI